MLRERARGNTNAVHPLNVQIPVSSHSAFERWEVVGFETMRGYGQVGHTNC